MIARSFRRPLVLLALGASCAGGAFVACSDDKPPGEASTSDAGPLTGDAGPQGDGDTPPGDAGSESSIPADAGEDAPIEVEPDAAFSCELLSVTGNGKRIISFATPPDFASLGGVTPEHLNLLWTSSSGVVSVADRDDDSSDFGPSAEVTTGVPQQSLRAGITPDGTTVVVAFGTSLAVHQRQAAGAPWAGPSTTRVGPINTWLGQQGGTISDPVIGSRDARLLYLHTPASGAPKIYEAFMNPQTGIWENPTPHDETSLTSSDGTHRRIPLGLSWDSLTLFYWDEVDSLTHLATRHGNPIPFTDFSVLGNYPEATPNFPCRRIYFRGTDDAGIGVFASSGTL